jgi:hypothetical protein
VLNDDKFCEKRREEIDAICRIVHALSISPHSRENSYYKYALFLYPISSKEKQLVIEKKFPWISEINDRLNVDYQPLSTPSFVKDIKDAKDKQLVLNFIGSLEMRDEICIYYGHKIASMKEAPIKFYNSKKPVYMIFYLIDYVLSNTLKKVPYKMFIEVSKRWYKELNPIKEDFLCWQHLLLFIIKYKGDYTEYVEPKKVTQLYKLYSKNIDEEKVIFDEWVYDMHTRIGKMKGKGAGYFAKESSFVCNEIEDIHQGYKDVYTYSKIIQDDEYNEEEDEKKDEEEDNKENKKNKKSVKKSIKSKGKGKDKESEFANFAMRAQLVTGNSKTDTYYAEKNGKLMFIKGPIELESVTPFLQLQKIKETLGLPTLNYRVVYLIPDLFGKTPLGRRNSLDRSTPHPFIVSDVLFNHTASDLPYRYHSSKLWPETQLVDFDKVKGMEHLNPSHLDDIHLTKQYVQTIIFRYVMGLGDIAVRNFIIKEGKIYSIDEDILDKDFNLENNLNRHKAIYEKMKKYIKKNKESVMKNFSLYDKIDLKLSEQKRLDFMKEFIENI